MQRNYSYLDIKRETSLKILPLFEIIVPQLIQSCTVQQLINGERVATARSCNGLLLLLRFAPPSL